MANEKKHAVGGVVPFREDDFMLHHDHSIPFNVHVRLCNQRFKDMTEKKFTEKEVISLLEKQRKSDAELLKGEPNISGFTAMTRVLSNELVYTKKDVE